MFKAEVVLDSISPTDNRLTTIEVTYPHAIHKDIMTHRALSRNFLSFRAWPIEKVIEQVETHPFIPTFEEYDKGMVVGGQLPKTAQCVAREIWLEARDKSVAAAKKLTLLKADKGHVNMLLQDFAWITGIISATDWDNFWALRAFPPPSSKPRAEVVTIARMMYDAYRASTPQLLNYGEWAMPYVSGEEIAADPEFDWKAVSTGRCARISYLTHRGIRDPSADVGLHDNLLVDMHLSPFEQVARPNEGWSATEPASNYVGWHQYRKDIPNEQNFAEARNYDYELTA